MALVFDNPPPLAGRKKLFSLRRPKVREPPPPAALFSLAAAASRRLLYDSVNAEIDPGDDDHDDDHDDDDNDSVGVSGRPPSWRSPRLLRLKGHLHSVLGEGGAVLKVLYDSVFNLRRDLASKSTSAATFGSPLAEDRKVMELEDEAAQMHQRRLFAVWWLFIPTVEEQEEEEEREKEGAAPSAMRFDFPVLSVDSEFYLQMVTCLATERPLRLMSLTLSYNWILKRDTMRMFANLAGSLRHLRLGGTLTHDILSVLERHVKLSTFTILKNCGIASNAKAALHSFLLSQSDSLEELDLVQGDGEVLSADPEGFFRSLQGCRKLTTLRIHSAILPQAPLSEVSVPSVREIHLDYSNHPGHAGQQSCQGWSFRRLGDPTAQWDKSGGRLCLARFGDLFPSCRTLAMDKVYVPDGRLVVEDFSEVRGILLSADVSLGRVRWEELVRFLRLVGGAERLDLHFQVEGKVAPLHPNEPLFFPRLRHLAISAEDLCYGAFAPMFFGAPRLVSFHLSLPSQTWMSGFDQADFVDRLRRSARSAGGSNRALKDLRHFRTETKLRRHPGVPVPDEEMVTALLEVAGESLLSVGQLLWLRPTAGARAGGERRLVEEAARKGLTEAKYATERVTSGWTGTAWVVDGITYSET